MAVMRGELFRTHFCTTAKYLIRAFHFNKLFYSLLFLKWNIHC